MLNPIPKRLPAGYCPSESELKKYHNLWDSLQTYVEHEEALQMIFRELPDWRLNTSLKHVIIKCSVLNDFYATNIYQIEPVAQKIVNIKDFDQRIKAGDPTLVDEVAQVEINGKNLRFYSFASKFCAHHNNEAYPIYDRYVDDVIWDLHKQYPRLFKITNRSQLKQYTVFKEAVSTIQREFGLEEYSFKDIDRYLWQLGKEFFNRYQKSNTSNKPINQTNPIMSKKSAISGEYIITVEDSGSVRVCKIYDNVKGSLRECAEAKGFEYDSNWTTRQFGSKLIKEFGEGNDATIGEYTIVKRDSGTIESYRTYENTKGALREIAEETKFEFDPDWTTRQFGSKLVDFINSNK